jgi:hypothetical protein
VQGQLRQEYLEIDIASECGHCGKRISLRVDSEMDASLDEADPSMLIFFPQIAWDTFEEPTIIDAY